MGTQLLRPFFPLLLAALIAVACGDGDAVILATTTSVRDSGLLDELLPLFEEQTGYHVKVIAVGTGAALQMGARGDADVLLVHAPDAEEELVAAGDGINRRLVMHNDFIIVGPAEDPAGIAGAPSAPGALSRIAAAGALFLSRGDDSGTHQRERSLWGETGIDPTGESWYQETGQGMGETLTVASEKDAYTLSDRGTYLAFAEGVRLVVLVEGDPRLLNLYSVIEVNPQKHPRVNGEGARAFADFLLSPTAQALIGSFGVERFGQPPFVPDAGRVEAELTGAGLP